MNKKMPTLALLAGGMATRMRPLTEKIPKSMVPINGVPFIDYQLRLFKNQGIERIVIIIGHLGKQIVDYVGNGSRYGLTVLYSFDGEKLLGTGGALKNTLPLLEDTFLVTYGDVYLTTDYKPIIQFFWEKNISALMTVFHNRNQWDKSNVEFSDGIIKDYNKKKLSAKMEHIDYGLCILKKSVFTDVTNNNDIFDLSEVLIKLIRKNSIIGYEVKERFFEIGSHDGLTDTSQLLLTKLEII